MVLARVLHTLERTLPRSARAHLELARRDLRMVRAGLWGDHGPALVPRRAPADYRDALPGASHVPLAARTLVVTALERETKDAVTVVLADRSGAPFVFEAGQFLTIELGVGGATLRRAYSISSAPFEGRVAVTVKRVMGGVVSTYVNEHLRVGDEVRVLGPSGTFVLGPRHARGRELVLVAGGSGITPIFSIVRAVLVAEPDARVTLFYANRREEDVIFARALTELAERHAGRLTVDHVLEEPPPGWRGGRGRLDRATFLDRLRARGVSDAPHVEWMLCGPEGMRAEVRAALEGLAVAPGRIREESYVTPRAKEAARPASPQRVHLRVKGREHEVLVPPDRTVLEAAGEAGVPVPFSCAMGGCGACKLVLVDGDYGMDEPNCLSPEERAAGYVLTCVGHAHGPCTLADRAEERP
jgi:ferredoxin-NADP reductase